MIKSSHATSQEAWEYINEFLAIEESTIKRKGGIRTGNNIISYDHFMEINKMWVDPEFDFGKIFGYKIQKWSKLISNYVDFDFLDIVKSQVQERESKKASNYTFGFKFSNKHTSGHGCLLTLVFSRRLANDNPIVILNIRSSEVTKRLLMDLLLVERMTEYVYGKDHGASLKIFCGHMYLTCENFVMYHNHKNLHDILKKSKSEISKRSLELIDKFTGMDPETVKYKVHRRAVKRINNVSTPELKAKALYLANKPKYGQLEMEI